MFILQSEFSFDSAHRLEGHDGNCRKLHGHRWRVVIQVESDRLKTEGSERDMVLDFSELKKDLTSLEKEFDHKLIEEGEFVKIEHEVVTVPFRPTAERMAQYFYHRLKELGYTMTQVTIYETPNNAITYKE